MSGYIKLWEFGDAPSELRALSKHGGDEDWIALVPAGRAQPIFTEKGCRQSEWFGCCDISEHDWKDGAKVYIGAHA